MVGPGDDPEGVDDGVLGHGGSSESVSGNRG